MVDVINIMVKSNPEVDIVKIANEKEIENKGDYVIETKVPFLPYVSTRTFLRCYRDNQIIDFARYNDKSYNYEELNNINVPLFMRWGNNKELVSRPAESVASICNEKIKNNSKDIGVIDGATHNYTGKEELLACEILKFIDDIKN